MTLDEKRRYADLREKFFQNSELLEFLDLHIQNKNDDLMFAIAYGRDVHGVAGIIAGVAELRKHLSEEKIEKKEEE